MCLSVPAKVISIEGQSAEVEVYGEHRQVYLAVDSVGVGDWVLIYGNVALSAIDNETACQTVELLKGLV